MRADRRLVRGAGPPREVPADRPGAVQENTAAAEITGLTGRAEDWPEGLRWIVRRTKPSRRQLKNLTALEKKTGWRYSIIVTNTGDTGIKDVPGSHHPQFIDVLHREHAVVEDRVRVDEAIGLRNLPSKTWDVNCGWVLAANIAADLDAWCRHLGLYDQDGLKDAEPSGLRDTGSGPNSGLEQFMRFVLAGWRGVPWGRGR